MKLSHNAQEAIKTALAMTVAYGVGLSMGWDRPYWAGFVVAFCSLATVGQSFNKSTLRMLGTVMAAGMALTVISLTAQQRWLFILCISLWCGFCTYMMTGKRNQYFWHVSGFVFVIICIDGGPYPDDAFATAMMRLQQTGLGILVYSLIALFLWPQSSGAQMKASTLELIDTQTALFRTSIALFIGQSQDDSVQTLHARELSLNGQFGALLDAAISDTDEVREAKQLWRDYQSANLELTETMQRLRENIGDLHQLPLHRLLPGLEAFTQEVENRFDATKRMLDHKDAGHRCTAAPLDADIEQLQALGHFQSAALMVARHHLLHIERLSLRMFDTIRAMDHGDTQIEYSPAPALVNAAGFIPDPERLVAALKVMTIMWLAFLAVVYIADFPGGFGFVTIVTSLSMPLLTNPQIPVSLTYVPAALSVAFGAFLYIFVMPQLSSFIGLGLMIFAATFLICYRYASPQQGLGRAFGLALFIVLISVSNQQSYNFLSVASTALMFALLFLLLKVMSYLPYSPRPERALLRLLHRYFRSAVFLLEQPARARTTWTVARREAFHRQEIASLPSKLSAWAGHADPAVLGAASAQQLPALMASVQALSMRQQELHEARALPQSQSMRAALADDMEAWRQQVIEAMQLLSADLSQGRTLVRNRLDERLQQLEKRITETLNDNQGGDLDPAERENFYRLLAAYRGTSDALLDFAELVVTVDWDPCYQERFA